jgi:diacylglycerol kinase (ATP)
VPWTAVVNARAGRRRGAREIARVDDALRARGVPVHRTADADEGAAVAAAAFGRGDGVLACGGDGTVQGLAECAATHDGLLAVVPVGSGNDFARSLGLDPDDPLGAVRVAESGRETRVDLGRIRTGDGTTRLFTTVAHSGMDGEVNRWANSVTRLSGTTLYAVAALRAIATYRPAPMRLRIDDTEWSGAPWLVAVANTRVYGGGMAIAPPARIDDGHLDVVVVSGVSRATVLTCFPRMIRGSHLGIDGVEHFRATTVTVEGPDGQEIYAGGEPIGPLPATVEAVPGALRVMVPAAVTR